ncbi:4487_t:CDS:2, partial [Racocetra persica]
QKVIKTVQQHDKTVNIKVIYAVCDMLDDSNKKYNARLKVPSGSTSNLISYLSSKHGIIQDGPGLPPDKDKVVNKFNRLRNSDLAFNDDIGFIDAQEEEEEDTPEESNDKLGYYLFLPNLDYRENPLPWWNFQKSSLFIFSELARQYLTVPATSTPSERLFSDANNMMTIKRTMLKPKLFEHMLFLKHNNDELDDIYVKTNILD